MANAQFPDSLAQAGAAPILDQNGNPAVYLTNDGSVITNKGGKYVIYGPGEDGGGSSGRQFGGYAQWYNSDGTKSGAPMWEARDRSGGWIGENLNWLGPLAVGGFAALATLLGPATATSVASATQAGTTGAATSVGAAPISASTISSLGPAATVGDALAMIGVPAGTLPPALSNLGLSLASPASSLVSKLGTTGLNSLINSVTGGQGGGLNLGGLLTAGAGALGAYEGMQGLKDLGTRQEGQYKQAGLDAQTDYGMLGGSVRDTYSDWADNIQNQRSKLGLDLQGMEKQAGQDSFGRWNSFGENASGLWNGVRDTYVPKYQKLADEVKAAAQGAEFKPFNITTNLGATTGNTFALNAGNQNVNDLATKTAGNAFQGASTFDPATMRQTEYNLMQDIYRPDDEAQRVALEERRRKQGRLDVVNGQGYNPELASFERGIQDRNMKSYLTADDQAMKRYGEFVGVGNAAMQTPMALDRSGQGMLQLGANLGNMQNQSKIQSINTWAPYAQRPIDTGLNLDTTSVKDQLGYKTRGMEALDQGDQQGIDRYAPLANQGIDDFWRFQQKGFDSSVGYQEKGLQAKYDGLTKGLAAKFGSEKQALGALVNIYTALAGGARSMFGNTNTPTTVDGALNQILGLLRSNGMSDTEALNMVDQLIAQGVPGAETLGADSFVNPADYGV